MTRMIPISRGQHAVVDEIEFGTLSQYRAYARKFPAKEGATLANMTPSGFKKLQAGDNAISYENLTFWLKRDPVLAAMYAAHVGLIRPGEAEFAGALTQAFNAYQRRPRE